MRGNGEKPVAKPAENARPLKDVLDYLATLPPLGEDFPDIEDPPPEPVDL